MKLLALLFIALLTGKHLVAQHSLVQFPSNVDGKARAYSQVATVDLGNATLIQIAGQVPLNPKGELVGPGNLTLQTTQVYENIKQLLHSVGAEIKHLTKCNIYLTDMSKIDSFRKVRMLYLDSINPPISTLVQVTALYRPDVLIEIDAIAILPKHTNSITQEKERQNVYAAMLDYVEGFYNGDTTKINRSVSRSVAKYGYWINDQTKQYQGSPMSFTEMVKWVTTESKKLSKKINGSEKIEVYDVLDKTASGKVTAWWGTDYVLLEKIENKWFIKMVLWQSLTK